MAEVSRIFQSLDRFLLPVCKYLPELIHGIPLKHPSDKPVLQNKFNLILYSCLVFIDLMEDMGMLPALEQWIAHLIDIRVWLASSDFGLPGHAGQHLAWKMGSLSHGYFVTAWLQYPKIQSFGGDCLQVVQVSIEIPYITNGCINDKGMIEGSQLYWDIALSIYLKSLAHQRISRIIPVLLPSCLNCYLDSLCH